jgi:hypothetical protein
MSWSASRRPCSCDPTVTQLWKPWVKGEILKTNKFGIVGWQRPSKGDMTPYIYIGKDRP